MLTHVVYIHLDQPIEECMALMTEKRTRHLPVIENGKLAGLISIGDIVKSIIADQQFTIEQLVLHQRVKKYLPVDAVCVPGGSAGERSGGA